ncbi:MAG: reverse transcriptase domain-containing protein [Pseudonocardiaceae bacterium]
MEIPKQHGDGMRMLGIPCVGDRVAQTVVARHLGVRVEPAFHEDSYGYRPEKSALDAVERRRERCWKKNWVIDLDVAKFFDSVRSDLIVKAVETHTDAPWVHVQAEIGQTEGRNDVHVLHPGDQRQGATAIRQQIRGMRFHLRSDLSFHDIAKMINAKAGAWAAYFGRFRPSETARVLNSGGKSRMTGAR